jgi:hypothetical protein
MKLSSHPNNRAPLDALVIYRLEAILNAEKQLRQRYKGLNANPCMDNSEEWAIQVRDLTVQTDRLARMLDALDGKYVADPIEKSTLAAA